VPEFAAQSLLRSPTVTIRDVYCQGSCRDPSAEEHATATELVFPYRGVYVRHLGNEEENVMIEKTCAACDCKLDGSSIKVGIGGKTVEVCCDEELREHWQAAEQEAR
jgi:hypothetical protein